MKLCHIRKSLLMFTVIFAMLLCACSGTKMRKINVVTTELGKSITTDTLFSETASSYITETTAEGAEKAPSVPYTLKHTVTDLSDRLPDGLPEINTWTLNVDNRNTYLIGNTLYLYTTHDETGASNPMLYHFTVDENGIEQGKTEVPMIQDQPPFYVYPLSGGRLVQFFSIANYKDAERPVLSYVNITEADGTILAEISIGEEYQYRPLNYMLDILVKEEDNQDITILLNGQFGNSYKIMAYQFSNGDHSISLERTMYHDPLISDFRLTGACRTEEKTYIYPSTNGYAELNLESGVIQQKKLRIPKDKELMWRLVDASGQIYLYDRLKLYQYNDEGAPIECIEWEKCNFSCKKSVYDGQIFAVNSNTFFYKISEKKGGVSKHYLYCIQTERVPDTDTRPVILYDCYAHTSQWLLDAVSEFNNTNENYRVQLNIINTATMSVEEVELYLQERMLSSQKTDIFTMGLGDMHVTFDKYYEKNIFLDLMPYFGDTLLGCVKEALSWKDALYTVPMDMALETFVCLPSQQKGFLTWEDFFWCMDSLKDGEYLTTESSTDFSVQEDIFQNGIMDFFDREGKTSSYNTAAFRNMVRYTSEMNQYIDESAGYLSLFTGGDFGYTNPTLPRRIADGGVKYIKTRVYSVDMLPGLGLLFGESGYNWCGYPSNEGGGAGLYMGDRTCVIADSAVKDGCIEFLSLLLADKWQTATENIRDLPVTESAIRAQLAQCRYNYYDIDTYNAIGDPNAAMRNPSMILPGKPVTSYISLKQSVSRNTKLDESLCVTTYPFIKKNGEVVTMTEPKYQMVELTNTEMENFLYFLNNCHMKANTDPTLRTIVEEELSYWQGGVSSLADASEKIQSRVWIYLNE